MCYVYVKLLSCETQHSVPLYVPKYSEMTKANLTWIRKRNCLKISVIQSGLQNVLCIIFFFIKMIHHNYIMGYLGWFQTLLSRVFVQSVPYPSLLQSLLPQERLRSEQHFIISISTDWIQISRKFSSFLKICLEFLEWNWNCVSIHPLTVQKYIS